MEAITLIPNNSFIVATPEEGRQLAVKMARLIIKLTQPDDAKRKEQREIYANLIPTLKSAIKPTKTRLF